MCFCYHWQADSSSPVFVLSRFSWQLVVEWFVYKLTRAYLQDMSNYSSKLFLKSTGGSYFSDNFSLLSFSSPTNPSPLTSSKLFSFLILFLPPACSFVYSSAFRWPWWSAQVSLLPGPPTWASASGVCFTPRSRTTWLHLSPCYHASSPRAPPCITLLYISSSNERPGKSSDASREWCFVVPISSIQLLK